MPWSGCSPILAFTSEEIWSYLKREGDPISVQLAGWPTVDESTQDPELEAKWERIFKVREVVSKALEEARRSKIIGHSLSASVHLLADSPWLEDLRSVPDLDKIFIVSAVSLEPGEPQESGYVSLEEVPGIWVKVQQASAASVKDAGFTAQRWARMKPIPRCAAGVSSSYPAVSRFES